MMTQDEGARDSHFVFRQAVPGITPEGGAAFNFLRRRQAGRVVAKRFRDHVHSNFSLGFIQMRTMSTMRLKTRMSAP